MLFISVDSPVFSLFLFITFALWSQIVVTAPVATVGIVAVREVVTVLNGLLSTGGV